MQHDKNVLLRNPELGPSPSEWLLNNGFESTYNATAGREDVAYTYTILQYDEASKKFIRSMERKIIKKFNEVFDSSDNGIARTITRFLLNCCLIKRGKYASYYDIDKFFYPSLYKVDLDDVWNKIEKHLIKGLGEIRDFDNSKEQDYTSEFFSLAAYMDDYCSIVLETRFANASGHLKKLQEDEIMYFCALLIREFLQQLDLIHFGKADVGANLREELFRISVLATRVAKENADLVAANDQLKLELSKKASVKEKIIRVEDTTRISELNKGIKRRDHEIAQLKSKVEELSQTHEIVEKRKENGKDVDFDKKFVFVGGHFNTVQQLEKLFCNACFYSREAEVDKDAIRSADGIVYLTDFMSHTIYYKVKNLSWGISQVHCTGSNVLKILEAIAENIE